VFVFDSGTKAILSSGRFGAPQAIIDAAGARNALEDLQDTWVEVSWERMLTSKPEAFVFVDYPPQTFAEKVAILKARTGVRDLAVVKGERFLNLPYAMWTSGPLNIEAAERLRAALERWGLVPRRTAGATSRDR
jgi:iron complex transport system substrate-binding protein